MNTSLVSNKYFFDRKISERNNSSDETTLFRRKKSTFQVSTLEEEILSVKTGKPSFSVTLDKEDELDSQSQLSSSQSNSRFEIASRAPQYALATPKIADMPLSSEMMSNPDESTYPYGLIAANLKGLQYASKPQSR